MHYVCMYSSKEQESGFKRDAIFYVLFVNSCCKVEG